MVQKEIVKTIAERLGLTEKQVEEMVNSQGELTVRSMKEGKSIKLHRFGKFVPISRLKDYRLGNLAKPARSLKDKNKDQEL